MLVNFPATGVKHFDWVEIQTAIKPTKRNSSCSHQDLLKKLRICKQRVRYVSKVVLLPSRANVIRDGCHTFKELLGEIYGTLKHLVCYTFMMFEIHVEDFPVNVYITDAKSIFRAVFNTMSKAVA